MSHRIYKSNVARQQAYRDRLAAKQYAARMTEAHNRGWHIDHRSRPYIVRGCPLCTVTPIQIPVTVEPNAEKFRERAVLESEATT